MRGWICAMLGVALLATSARAAPADKTLEVAPTTLDLRAGEAGLLYIANHSAQPITVQIDIYNWSQPADGDHLALSNTAFVSPPLTTIAPGERQIVRVLAQPEGEHEASYRLRVSELPNPVPNSAGVQVLLQFSIPAFVPGTKNENAISWTASAHDGTLVLKVHNEGGRAIKLAGLRISPTAGAPVAIAPDRVSYVLPGSEHVWTVDAPALAQSDHLHLEGVDERSGKSVTADIGIAR